jgi:hypothetical protein
MLWLFGVLLSCSDSLLSKHTVEEKYIYPSYYDVWVETDTAIIEVEIYISDTADPDPIWVDSFVQPSGTDGVDIIWVIDPSGSMQAHQTRVLQGIADMMNALPTVNWRLAIISADQNHSVSDSVFPLLPGDTVINAQSIYQASVVGSLEAGMYSVYNYIEHNSFSSNWLREEASLLIVFVSDEEDQSTAQFPLVSSFTDWLSAKRSSVYIASIINFTQEDSQCNSVNPINVGHRYTEAAQHYNGQVLDICSSDWSAGVIDAANGAVPYSSYPLTEVPADYNYISVFVDGMVYHDAYWDYNPIGNKIDFILEPSGNSLVEIAYYYSSGN